MKLGMAERTDISAGVQEEIKIAFEANAVAFYAQISGLDPIFICANPCSVIPNNDMSCALSALANGLSLGIA